MSRAIGEACLGIIETGTAGHESCQGMRNAGPGRPPLSPDSVTEVLSPMLSPVQDRASDSRIPDSHSGFSLWKPFGDARPVMFPPILPAMKKPPPEGRRQGLQGGSQCHGPREGGGHAAGSRSSGMLTLGKKAYPRVNVRDLPAMPPPWACRWPCPSRRGSREAFRKDLCPLRLHDMIRARNWPLSRRRPGPGTVPGLPVLAAVAFTVASGRWSPPLP